MIEYLKSAAAIAVAACILLGALLFAHSKIRKDGISDSADAAGATTSAAASSDHKERLELVRELCARTGIDEPRLTRVLDSQASPSVPLAPSALPVPTRESSRAGEAQATRGPSAYEVIDAVQFALEAAGRDDDYGSIGVEHEADDGPQQIELTLLDWKQRDRAELLTKLIANAQDISVEKRFAPQRGVLEG